MDTQIMIRDGGPHGPDLSLPAAIARLCDGEQVTVTPVDASTPDGDPRGEPRPGFDITVYPARTAYTRLEPPKVNWAGIGSRPAADAALFAETLTLASQLATYASLGQPTAGQAAAIGEGDGRDAARRALGASTPETCQAIVKGLDDGDHMVYDMFRTPALSGEHDISYDAVDLAADLDLGLDPDSAAMTDATEAYVTAAGEAFWAEAERIARERVAPAARTPGRSSR